MAAQLNIDMNAGQYENIQHFDYCGCSYTWTYDFTSGRMTEVRIPCCQHAPPPQPPRWRQAE